MKLCDNDNVVVPVVVVDYCSGHGIDLHTIHLCLKEKTHKNFELNNGADIKITECICSKFLASSFAFTTSFHSNSFDSVVDEENSASSQVDALLSASFELEEKVVNILNSLHMEKEQNKETEIKFEKLSAKYKKRKKKYLPLQSKKIFACQNKLNS